MISTDAHPGADATDNASEPATPTSPTSPNTGPVRRPVGPKSRRPPTQLLTRSEAGASSLSVAAEAVLSPTIIIFEDDAEDADTGAVAHASDECMPAAETQDEDVVAPLPPRSPIPMRRPLPHGAVPLLVPGGGGAGGLSLPRFSRVPSPQPQQDALNATTAAAATEEPAAPKPRRSPGPAAALPGLGGADPVALRLQLRKTIMPRSPDFQLPENPDAADHVELSSPSPPPKPRLPRPHDTPDGPSPESPVPRQRRAPPGAPAATLGLANPDFLAARQHLRKTVAPGALLASPEAEVQGPPQLLPQPQPRRTPPARPPPPQLQQGPPPPPLPPKPREQRMGGVRDENGDKAAVH